MIRILIVEDHEMVRDAIASLLGEVPDMEVVATACNIRDALPLLDKHRPQVVLADLALDDGSGTELVRSLGRGRSRRRLLILTGLRDAFAARDALARSGRAIFCRRFARSHWATRTSPRRLSRSWQRSSQLPQSRPAVRPQGSPPFPIGNTKSFARSWPGTARRTSRTAFRSA